MIPVLTPAEIQVLALALGIALWVVVLSVLPGIGVAWILVRWKSRWRNLLQGLVLLPLVLPPVVTGYGLLLLFGRSAPLGKLWFEWTGVHLSYSFAAAVLAAAVVSFPLLVESVRLSLESVDERLEKVSRSLGWGRWSTFWRVTLPLGSPGILAGATLAFARALGEFGATIILAGNIAGETRQIPVAVYTLLNEPGQSGAVLRLCGLSVLLSLGSLGLAGALRQNAKRKAGRA